jgi:phosphoglycolate phosphatase
MQSPQVLVFDLDGTLSDPAAGICRCMNYSLTACGFPELTEREVSRYIGPPLDLTFRQVTGSASDELISDMVARFRERYGRIGYRENTLYPGISKAVSNLATRKIPLGICTSKRTDFAEKILELFQLREYFSFVSGGDIGIMKADQLRALVRDNVIDRTAVMIGDRAVDILAARTNGLSSVGVLWGYGSKTELQEAAPERLLERPEQLADLAGVREG